MPPRVIWFLMLRVLTDPIGSMYTHTHTHAHASRAHALIGIILQKGSGAGTHTMELVMTGQDRGMGENQTGRRGEWARARQEGEGDIDQGGEILAEITVVKQGWSLYGTVLVRTNRRQHKRTHYGNRERTRGVIPPPMWSLMV